MLRAALLVLVSWFAFTPAALRAQAWSLDPAVAPAIVNDVSMLLNATFVPAGSGQFLAWGDFTHVNGTATRSLARLGADGRPDPTFAPDLGSDERVVAAAPLPEGRYLAVIGPGGLIAVPAAQVSSSGPVPLTPIEPTIAPVDSTVVSPAAATRLIRLRADGRKDSTFAALAIDGYPRLTPLSDGRILMWGSFRSVGGTARNSLARLNMDGTLDAAFAPALASQSVNVVAVGPTADGGFVVSAHTTGAARPSYFLTRLLTSGSVDTRFAPAPQTGTYRALAVQADGTVYAAGNFNVFRFNATGELDRTYSAQIPFPRTINQIVALSSGRLVVDALAGSSAFGAPAVFTLGADGRLERDLRKSAGAREGQHLLSALPDGRVLLAQGSLVVPSLPPYVLAANDPAATASAPGIAPIYIGPSLVDLTIAISTPDAAALSPLATTITYRTVASISRIEPDGVGGVFVAGTFTHVDGQPRAGLARFLSGGALDAAFTTSTGNTLLLVPPDGRPIVRRTLLGPVASDGFHRYVTDVVRLRGDGSVEPGFSPPAGIDAANTNWLLAAPDGRLLVSAFDPDANREEDLKLIWLGADGRRLATLAATFTGFTRFMVYPMQTTIPSGIAAGDVGATVSTEVPAVVVDPTVTTVPPAVITDSTAIGGPVTPIAPIPFPYARPNVIDAAQLLPGDRLLIAGAFTRVNGTLRPMLVQLRPDGAVETGYNPALSPLRYINSALPLPDGRALLFGGTVLNGRWQPRVARLRTDGSVDPAFQPPDPGALRYSTRVMADGSLFANGRRYTADGWLDLNFAPQLALARFNSHGYIYSAAVTAGGRLWVGGIFDTVNGQSRSGLARYTSAEIVGITVSPRSQTVIAGRDAILQVVIGTSQPATYRWTFNGATIAGATTALLRLPAVRVDQAGVYRAVIAIGSQTFTSDPATLTVVPGTSRLVNFSARSVVAPGTPPQIAGVVCAAVPPRTVLLRAVGRGLPANVGSPALPFPVLTLYDGGRSVAEDRGGALAPPITTLASSVGAFPLNVSPQFPGTIYGSALALTLGPGAFTAMTSSGDAGAGMSLFEFYDSGAESAPPLVRNVAIRGQTAPGAAVLTAGFVISGNGPLRLLIRGLGPALSGFGLAGVVADPTLTVHSAGAGAVVATNDGWAGDSDLANAARATGAFPLSAASRDAALVLTVEPGAYTVQLISASGASGAAMIEIYVLDE